MSMTCHEQNQLLKHINEFKSKKKVKAYVINNARALLNGREMVFKAF